MSIKRFTNIISLSVLSALMMSPHAEAKISIKAFKNITKHFKPHQEFNSPTFGEAALYSGLMYDLRFYGNIEPSFKKGQRRYIEDEGLDSVAELAKELFPSPTGALNVETGGDRNFGRYVDKPETVALLINFAHEIRKEGKWVKDDWADSIFNTLTNEAKNKRGPVKKTIEFILNSIRKSITEESQNPYPKYSTEQVISAFFCEKFSTQNDIWALLRAMDDDIVDKKDIPQKDQHEDLLKGDDLEFISKKEGPYDADDIFALENADIFGGVTPYKPGVPLLSNGNTRPYDRTHDRYDPSQSTYADCAEMAARHAMNLLAFNDETQEFDLSHLKTQIKEDNPYFKNFDKFYTKQTPLLANAGDIDMRSLWGKVLGDLNREGDPIKISYVKGTNELETGYINIVRAFQKVFGLTLDELPANADLKVKKKWLEKSLTTLFETLNPTRKYEFDLSTLTEAGNDLSGHLQIRIKNKFSKELFSFTYYSNVGSHSDVRGLNIPKTYTQQDFKKQLQEHATTITEEGTAEDVLWLAGTDLKKPLSDFYTLFDKHLSDNDSRIEALKQITMMKNSKVKELLPRILKNILADISWEDAAVLRVVSPIVSELMKNDNFRDLIPETVKGFCLSTDEDLKNPLLKSLFERITKLRGGVFVSNMEGVEVFKELKNLDLEFAPVQTLNVQPLSKLEKLNLRGTKIKDLSLENLTHLKTLNLADTAIKTLKGLSTLSSLEDLNLDKMKELEEVSLTNMTQLKRVSLSSTPIKRIEGLNTLTNLEELSLDGVTNLEEVSLSNLNQLKLLWLNGVAIKKVNLNNLPNLEEIRTTFTKEIINLEEISLTNLAKLKSLGLNLETVKRINFDNLENFEEFRAIGLNGFEEICLTNLPKLRKLSLSHLNGKKVSLNNIACVEVFGLGQQDEIEELSLLNLPHLKKVSLNYAHVKKLNLNRLDHLEVLDSSSSKVLKS